MAWKVRTRNENVRPPMETSSIEYASKDEALNAACDDLDHSVHVKVLYIEGPTEAESNWRISRHGAAVVLRHPSGTQGESPRPAADRAVEHAD
jgi:hypothetical protein